MNETDDPWTVERTDRGYVLRYDDLEWPMEPKADEEEARAYLERVRQRYGGDRLIRSICAR